MKLYELVDKYHRDTDYTCAEAMLKGCNEYYGLNLSKESISLLSIMGVGMQTEISCCGAYTIAVAIIGLFTNPEAKQDIDNQLGNKLVYLLTGKILNQFDSIQCQALNSLEIDGYDNPCDNIVVEIAKYLEELLDEYVFHKNSSEVA